MSQLHQTETADEVIQETRRIKEVLAQSVDFDIDRILEEARRNQQKGRRKVLSPPVQQEA